MKAHRVRTFKLRSIGLWFEWVVVEPVACTSVWAERCCGAGVCFAVQKLAAPLHSTHSMNAQVDLRAVCSSRLTLCFPASPCCVFALRLWRDCTQGTPAAVAHTSIATSTPYLHINRNGVMLPVFTGCDALIYVLFFGKAAWQYMSLQKCVTPAGQHRHRPKGLIGMRACLVIVCRLRGMRVGAGDRLPEHDLGGFKVGGIMRRVCAVMRASFPAVLVTAAG